MLLKSIQTYFRQNGNLFPSQEINKIALIHLFGLLSPGDEGAQVGGMCIENAGGVRAVKHGIMRSYIKGMKVCLQNGDIVQLGR